MSFNEVNFTRFGCGLWELGHKIVPLKDWLFIAVLFRKIGGRGMLCIPCFADAFVDERLCCAHCKCGARTKQVPEGQRNVQARLARLCHGIFSESLDTSLCVCALSVL